MMLAKNHRRVAVVERYAEVGGGCTHWGTIPSKALRHAVKTLARRARRIPCCANWRGQFSLTLPQLLSSAGSVIEAQVAMRRRFYDRNRVPVLEGAARFVDAHTLEITPRVEAAYSVQCRPVRDRHRVRVPIIRPDWISRIRACATATASCAIRARRSA